MRYFMSCAVIALGLILSLSSSVEAVAPSVQPEDQQPTLVFMGMAIDFEDREYDVVDGIAIEVETGEIWAILMDLEPGTMDGAVAMLNHPITGEVRFIKNIIAGANQDK